jgi:hypothetical protein
METPEGLGPVVANDPGGKSTKELVYKELLPSVPPADEEKESAKQEPAPVQDAKPKPVEKPVGEKPPAEKAAAEKPPADKPATPKPAEKKP